MNVKRRRLPNFDACSVALFASLALGSAALPSRSSVPSARSISFPLPRVAPVAPTLFLANRTALKSKPGVEPEPDGSISSPGFDEALK